MAAFAYDAINSQGLELSGVVHAPDLASAREQLQARGLLPNALKEKAGAGEGGARSAFKKVKPKSLQIFARQLATMIEAGVSVVASLVVLEEQTEDKYLQEVIADVRADVESGLVLSRALARHPKVFNRLFVSMVQAASPRRLKNSCRPPPSIANPLERACASTPSPLGIVHPERMNNSVFIGLRSLSGPQQSGRSGPINHGDRPAGPWNEPMAGGVPLPAASGTTAPPALPGGPAGL